MSKSTKRESWEVFCDTGMLWFVNRILHTMGWVIVVAYPDEEMGGPVEVYPARTTDIGFSAEFDAQKREVFLQHVGRTRIPRETDPTALPEDDQARLERVRQMTAADE